MIEDTGTIPRWSPELEDRYAPLAGTLEGLIPCLEVPLHLPWIDAINTLKRERGAVIMVGPLAPVGGAWRGFDAAHRRVHRQPCARSARIRRARCSKYRSM